MSVIKLKKDQEVFKGGLLVEQGTHSELRLKKGLYFQLSELQQKGLANF